MQKTQRMGHPHQPPKGRKKLQSGNWSAAAIWKVKSLATSYRNPHPLQTTQRTARVPPAFGHGASLLLDFENAFRRSGVESARYEFKQGILRLDDQRQIDNSIFSSLIETSCGIANVGADADGNIFLGVADKKIDTDRIVALDGVTPYLE